MPVVRKTFGLSASPQTTNAAAGTPSTRPQNHRQKGDMPALARPLHEGTLDRDRTGGAAGGSRATERSGPPSPVRRSKSDESGEWVTEPVARGPPAAPGPVRLTQPGPVCLTDCSLISGAGYATDRPQRVCAER